MRTRNRRGAGQLVVHVIDGQGTAGGHGVMAGGQIPLSDQDPGRLVQRLSQRTLEYLKVPQEAQYNGLV